MRRIVAKRCVVILVCSAAVVLAGGMAFVIAVAVLAHRGGDDPVSRAQAAWLLATDSAGDAESLEKILTNYATEVTPFGRAERAAMRLRVSALRNQVPSVDIVEAYCHEMAWAHCDADMARSSVDLLLAK
jgi:hypothetical protein